MPNRLAASSSPYLKQHQDNPIDWFEWSDEAFEKAKAEDKPIFLSIGYSSCHWCHVMAHESFEDPSVAEFINKYFVSIKVDREERPDVDEVYMTAVQMISGRGGWPITVFMTPDRKPFFAGTYFPKQDRGKTPGFVSLAANIVQLWVKSRPDVMKSANQIAAALEKTLGRAMGSLTSTIQPELFLECFNALKADFDGEHGGFGPAPKFPGHTSLAFLLDFAMIQPEAAPEALSMIMQSLERMALGGIYDQIGGGFHRYSTDAEWLLPHFEKMLCDNALLLGAYARMGRIANELGAPSAELYDQITIGVIEWLKREMMTSDGFFCSALDADSEGEEGLHYLWFADEIRLVLGDRADAFMAAYGFEEEGNYLDEATQQKTGRNIPHLKENLRGEFRQEIQMLLEARSLREKPMLDYKALAAWNAMTIRSLVEAEEILLAERCLRGWMKAAAEFGRLPHQVTLGKPSGDAFLDDYAHMALAAADVHAANGNPEYLAFGESLVAQMIAGFYDEEKSGFFFTHRDAETLFGRSKPALDQNMPSPNSVAIEACLAFGQMEIAEKSLMAVIGWAQKMPNAAESMIRTAMFYMLTKLAEERGSSEEPIALIETPKAAPIVGKVTAKLASREIVGGKGAVLISVPEGLHLNTNTPPARWLVPTELVFEGARATVIYPAGENEQYLGEFEIPFEVSVSEPTEFEVRVKFQACTNTECLAADDILLDGVLLPS